MSIQALCNINYAKAGFGGTLIKAFTSDFKASQPFLRRNPNSSADWSALLNELGQRSYPRQKLSETLMASNQKLGAPDAVCSNISALADDNTFAVITGQQAGLFGGPLYSLYKALTCIKLARQLNERHAPLRFVPIFWIASDDHDLDEIDHADFINQQRELKRVRADLSSFAGSSAGDVTLPGFDSTLQQELQALLNDEANPLMDAYHQNDLGLAFGSLLMKWLGAMGLIVVDSRQIRSFGSGVFEQELLSYENSRQKVQELGTQLKSAGFEFGFEKGRNAPHFFLTSNGIRVQLEPEEGGTFFRERSAQFTDQDIPHRYSKEELLELIRSSPDRFSPSAALRPVLQNKVFPVAATVLGPGEIAYWAQLSSLHDQFQAVWPMIVPRASLTLLDESALKSLRKLKAEPSDLFRSADDLRATFFTGGATGKVLSEHAQRILAELKAIQTEVQSIDRGLDPLLTKAQSRIENELNKILHKTNASIAQREGAGEARLAALLGFTHPKGRPQERVLCVAQFMAQHPELAEALLALIDPSEFEHLVVAL